MNTATFYQMVVNNKTEAIFDNFHVAIYCAYQKTQESSCWVSLNKVTFNVSHNMQDAKKNVAHTKTPVNYIICQEAIENISKKFPGYSVEIYKGYVVAAENIIELDKKKGKISRGETNGFYTIKQAHNLTVE